MSSRQRSPAEFVSEAQEVIDLFSRTLLDIERQHEDTGTCEPDLVNAAFRTVHSLKGLAGMFGSAPITALSHGLENTLDGLRLGRLALDKNTLDVLFEAVETFQRQLAALVDENASPVVFDGLLARIESLARSKAAGSAEVDLGWIDEAILGVLTEYEEHRLRENLRQGRRLFRIHASFDLMAIDTGIEALKERMKRFGEVITYLPSTDGSADDRIELDVLMGSSMALADLAGGISSDGVSVHPLDAPDRRPVPAPIALDPPSEAELFDLDVPAPTGRGAIDGERGGGREAGGDVSLRSLSQTVRVDLARLDHLMHLVGELGVVHANLGTVLDGLRDRPEVTDVTRELHTQVRSMQRKLGLLQQGILDVRMVPLGQVFDKLARVIRKLGRESGKDVRLTISGAETELDKLIVEELSDPLMHLIRNAIDHGIEMPNERTDAGKPPIGHIALRAFQKGNRVVLEVEDDGRGIDWREIRAAAVARGLVDGADAAELSPAEVLDLVFLPGFTTRTEVTELSGRGVGMDVVKTNISRLSGMIDIDTQPRRGSKFSVTLPVTLAIIQALVVESSGQRFCIPLNSVLESLMATRPEIHTVEGQQVISLRGRTLPLLYLSDLFELERSASESMRIYIVIVGVAQHRIGLVVDDLLGQQDVVIKPLGAALRAVPGVAGATELGANRTVLVLDIGALIAESMRRDPTAIPRESEARLDGP